MIFGQTKLELKVGIFVFGGLLILAMFILRIGDLRSSAGGVPVNFVFNFVNGVKLGAPVRFAGVDIGEVKAINFLYSPGEAKTRVQLVSLIRRDVKIPADSAVWVNTLGLLGEKYIEIMPGKDYARLVEPNMTIIGHDPMAMNEMGEMVKGMAENVNDLVTKLKSKEGTIGRLLYDDSLYLELEKSITQLTGTLDSSISRIGAEMEGLVTDLRKNPWKMFWKTKEKK